MSFVKNKRLYFKNHFEIWTYSILMITSVSAALLSVKNIVVTPDSITYALVSQEIISGNGIRVPMIWFDSPLVPEKGTVPLLIHPPLLPVLLAMLGGVTPQSFLAAQTLNVMCYAIISIFTFLLMKTLCNNKVIALLTGLLMSTSFPMLYVTHYIASEPLFISLTVGAIYFLIISKKHSDDSRNRLYRILAGILAGASILTRNTGIAVLGVFLWEILIVIKNKKHGSKLSPAISAAAIPLITLVMLYARNYMISGVIRGENQTPIERPYIEAFMGTIKMIFLQFQLGILSSTLIIVFIIALITYMLLNAIESKEAVKKLSPGLDSIIVYIVSYTTLIWLSMAKMQFRFELRFMSPLVPFLFIVSILIITIAWNITKDKGFYSLSLAGLILSVGLIASGNLFKTYLNLPEFLYNKHEKIYSILNSCLYDWLLKNYDKRTIIVTDKPFHLSFLGGYPTVILPHKKWVKTTKIPKDMELLLPKRMSEIGAKALVLFEKVEKDDFGSHLAGLFNKSVKNDRLVFAYECSDGVVYNLKE